MSYSFRYRRPFEEKTLVVILVCLCTLESNNDCGWDVKENGCPNYGTNEWNYLAWNRHCRKPPYVYHCARDYHNKEIYTEACALEKDCGLGTEPQIWTRDVQDETAKDTCELCFGNRYNDVGSRSSAKFWQCPKEQPEYTEENHFINCHGYTSSFETKSRCDARHNYVMLNTKYDASGCSDDTPLTCICIGPYTEGHERLPNYTCTSVCSKGYRRDTSDECMEGTSRTANLPEITTNEATKSSILVNDDQRQDTIIKLGVIARAMVYVSVLAVIYFFICGFYMAASEDELALLGSSFDT